MRNSKVRIKPDKKRLQLGEETTIRWKIKAEGIKSVRIEGVDREFSAIDEFVVKPDTTMRLTLIVKTDKGTAKKACKIYVDKPSISSFTLTKNRRNRYLDSIPIEVSWFVQNATRVEIKGIVDSLKNFGSHTFVLPFPDTLKLFAYNDFGVVASKELFVPIIVNEKISFPKNIYEGELCKIVWKYKQVKKIVIPELGKEIKSSGSMDLMPKKDVDFTLLVHHKNGNIDTVPVFIPFFPAQIAKINSTQTLMKGQNGVFSWKVYGGDSVLINGIKHPNIGYRIFKPKCDTTFNVKVYFDGKIRDDQTTKTSVIMRRSLITGSKNISELKPRERIDFEIFNIDYSQFPKEIKLYVLVVDTLGNYIEGIGGLSQKMQNQYFSALYETYGGKRKKLPFKIEEFTQVENSYDISLTMDYSGSMSCNIAPLENAVKMFVENKDNSDAISICQFDDKLNLGNSLIRSKKIIKLGLDNNMFNKMGGGTALYAGADYGISSLAKAKNKRVQILLTDGQENSSIEYIGQYAVNALQYVLKARKMDATVHIVGIGSGVNSLLLSQIAKLTGGNFHHLSKSNDILKLFQEFPIILRRYYVITYKPPHGEGEHKIAMYYNNRQNYAAQTQTLYHIGDDIKINQMEFEEPTYWNQSLDSLTQIFNVSPTPSVSNNVTTPSVSNNVTTPAKNNSTPQLKPIAPPQAVAHFDFNDAVLLDVYKQKLDTIAKYINKNPDIYVLIMGHTDKVGNANYCMELSKKRAGSVRDYLVSLGIETERIKIRGFGKTAPIWIIEDKPFKAHENRRIEMLLLK